MHTLLKNAISINLTTGQGDKMRVPDRSGLNWGQRPNRDQNQAYLSIPSYIQRSDFFPEIGQVFHVECDDGYKLQCVRAQANGKGLHSKPENSILGAYFRKRLSLMSGQLITLSHLYRYGRTTVDIKKIEHLHYFLDFSVGK